MPRSTPLTLLATALTVATALLATACGSDTPTSPDPVTPTELSESFDGALTVNGSVTHPFVVQRAGTVTVRFTALDPDPTAVLGLALGTWNGSACSLSSGIVKDDATLNVVLTGTASTVGNFCVWVHDTGKLTAPTSYQITVTHF